MATADLEQPLAQLTADKSDAGHPGRGAHGWDGMPLDYEACVDSLCG